MTDWRFYGRGEIIIRLRHNLAYDELPTNRRFAAKRIMGRRGVGKTHLLNEMARLAPADLPFIVYELANPAVADAETACARLLKAAEMAGIADPVALLPKRSQWDNDQSWFCEIVKAFLRAGAVVVLDEFHHAHNLGLVSGIKLVIDGADQNYGTASGTLVMMGSHQQQVLRMFRSDQPLYQRALPVQLGQWRLPTVMEMAAEQGILADPHRFLTLWCAYGGMPRNWKRYCTDRDYSHLHGIKDTAEWRQAFLTAEAQTLLDAEERFDGRSFIELAGKERDVLLWIGRNARRGIRHNRLADAVKATRAEMEQAYHVLRNHLQLVEDTGPWMTKAMPRWRITDNNTLFRINVFPELVVKGARRKGLDVDIARAINDQRLFRLQELEGLALERLTADWLVEQDDITWSHAGVWRPDMEGDIDALAVNDPNTVHIPDEWIPRVWLASAKRDAARHQPTEVADHQDRFLAALGNSDEAVRMRERERHRLLVSPEFSDEQRERHAQAGFACMDIHDMARSCGIKPEPYSSPSPF